MTSDFEIVKYSPDHQQEWDNFVESSKNGTFLFKRAYMDYHADRFHDNSFLFYKKGRLYSILPANINDKTLFSHQGLTYGGMIMDEHCTAEGVLELFNLLIGKLREDGIEKFIYKPVPHIYHTLPSEEDLYAIFRLNASLVGRNISSVYDFNNPLQFSKLRKRMVKRALKNEIIVRQTNDYASFWQILSENLKEKYGASPVHSLEEISNLSNRFSNIRLFSAFSSNEMIGGVLCYFTSKVIRVQYISANAEGKEKGAIDAIFNYLLSNSPKNLYFDFGTSNENGGHYLNESLIHQKQGFGARAICYDTYEIKLH